MIYGELPEDIGRIDISPVEMMCWMYCPISTPAEIECIPQNLMQFGPILDAVYQRDPSVYDASYVYLTAKTLWVSGECVGNRPGWHSDGFGSNDVNYIWYDREPTQFLADHFQLSDDCENAMQEMAERASLTTDYVTFPDKHLLRLTPAVIHRVAPSMAPGMRTFVKVSLSPDRYNLQGNSINHGLRESWPMLPRNAERNHPVKP